MITSDGPLTVDAAAAEDLRLLRRYEPVLRFTQGELFLPMKVESYLEKCSLWRLTGPPGACAAQTRGVPVPAGRAHTGPAGHHQRIVAGAGSLAPVRAAPAGPQGVPGLAA